MHAPGLLSSRHLISISGTIYRIRVGDQITVDRHFPAVTFFSRLGNLSQIAD